MAFSDEPFILGSPGDPLVSTGQAPPSFQYAPPSPPPPAESNPWQGIGLTMLGLGEGLRGQPLTAIKHQELETERAKVSNEERHRAIQLATEQHKAYRQNIEDARKFAETQAETIATLKPAAEKGDPQAIKQLVDSVRLSSKLYGKEGVELWKNSYDKPDAMGAFLDLWDEGAFDKAAGLAARSGSVGKMMTELTSNDKLMALIELQRIEKLGKPDEATDTIRFKRKGQEKVYTRDAIEDLRKRAGLASTLEKETAGHEARIKNAQANEATTHEQLKSDVLRAQYQTAQRSLREQDLKDYTAVLDRAVKLAGGGGVSFEIGAGGGSVLSMGDTSKMDIKKLIAALRDQADTAPGLSDKTRNALNSLATRMEGAKSGSSGPNIKRFDERGQLLP